MNAASEFDLGPLTWVKSEIDLALERAKEALARYDESGDATQLKFGRTHIHQVHGALSIVGLDGVTQVTESLEALLIGLEEGRLTRDGDVSATINLALSAIRQYLDDLMAGEPNQPLRLLPAYQALADARGQSTSHATDLFYPDLSARPPKRASAKPAVDAEELRKILRAQRMRYQKGLLTWLKNPEQAAAGLDAMHQALATIEATQETPAARAFWWAALGFSEALANPDIATENRAKQLCSRIDTQIRRQLEGSANVAERIMRDALYFVAQAPAGQSPLVAQIQGAFQLPAMLPSAAPSTNQPQEAALRRLRETLSTTEELWNKFCTGSQSVLPDFGAHARQCAALTADIGHTDLKRLGQGFAAMANWLAEDSRRQSDSVAMELATAILLLQSALDNFRRLGTDFAQQVDLMVARLHGCIAGKPVTDEGIPLLDEMTRRAQEKLLIGQVGREIQNNLAQVEQALDAFFRDPTKTHDLSVLDGPLKQIAGALTMLGHLGAVASLKACGDRIRQFAQAGYTPADADFEEVAQQLSLLGFFVDSLQHGESDYEHFVRKLQGGSADETVDEEQADEPLPQPTLEVQLEQQKKETQALLEAFKEAPQDERLKGELKQNLQALQKDADLVADHALGESAKAALSALEADQVATPAIDDAALSGLKPLAAEAPAPSAATLELAQASHEEIDAELLSIFLEEANEVLATIAEQAAILHATPHDSEALTTIRRSTHTLKGSGRMVGLKDLGEAAWELEQTLNFWLRQEQEVNADLLRMIDEEEQLFSTWVKHLEAGTGQAPDPSSLVALAARLRGAEQEDAFPTPPAATAVEPAVEPLVEAPPLAPEELPTDAIELGDFDLALMPTAEAEAPPAPSASEASLDLAIDFPEAASDDATLASEPAAMPMAGSEAALPPTEPDEGPTLAIDLAEAAQEIVAAEPEALAIDIDLPSVGEEPALQAGADDAQAFNIDFGDEADFLSMETPATAPSAAELATPVQTIELPVPEAADEAPSLLVELPESPTVDGEGANQEAQAEDFDAIDPTEVADLAGEPGVEQLLEATASALEDLLAPTDETSEEILRSTAESEQIPPAAIPPTVTASPTLYDIFREEARGHLQTLVDSYAQLELNPTRPTTFEMTRAAHTLGGIAATVGLMPLNHLSIALEHALLRRDGSGHPDSIEGLETVRQTIITLEGMFAALAEQQAPEEQTQLVAALEDIFLAPPAVLDAAVEAPLPLSAEIIPLPGAVAQPTAPLPEAESFVPPPAPALPQLKDELDEQLLPIFLEEAQDQLRALTEQLRAWRADPAAAAPQQALARLLHTFKGNARMAGAMNLGELTHLLETRVQEAVRTGKAGPALIDDIESGCDLLAQGVEYLLNGPPAEPAPPELSEASAPSATAPAEPAAPSPQGERERESEVEASGDRRATLRVRAELVDRLVNEAGELSIARARIEGEMRSLKSSLLDLTENVIRLRRQLRDIEIQAEGQIQARVAHTHEGEADFDPLELDRFTRFQELTRFMAESVNDVATVQQNLLKNLDDANAAIIAQARLNRGLQQELMAVRMIPFASLSERLYRIVRQTTKDVGKRASLDIAGGQVEMDRSVLDKILAPLEHMLRNAITHGIESQEQRAAAGKPEAGEIAVSLVQEGNEIILAMTDDGKGLDAARIRARAEEMGLLQPGQAADDASLFDFIFQPGFSTASELTQVSGRGVGMDVVKTEVTALGGRIEILSQPGKGTTFRLYLPLTLAVTQTLLVRVGAHTYAIPSTMIEQVQEMKEKALAGLREHGEAVWMGNHYPFHFLPHLLGDAGAVPEAHRQYWVLLLRSGTQRVAVLVDELKGNQEVVVKNIGAQLARVVGIDGATVLGDGRVVLILNPVALASRTALVSVQTVVAPSDVVPVASTAPSLPTVMVVDDSLTVRKITSRLLTREGYQVILAKDGVDALEQLIDARPDVILSDIEMPRMDGFDFVRNVRADDKLKNLPVIMITSRTADKHRNYALEIGANHYLGKPYDEDELLGLIAGYAKN